MQRLGLYLLGLASAFAFVSCEEVNFELPIPFPLEISETVEIPVVSDTVVIADTTYFSAEDEPELYDNLNNLTKLTLKEVLLSVGNFTINNAEVETPLNTDSLAFIKASATISLRYGTNFETEAFKIEPYGAGFVSLADVLEESPKTVAAEDLELDDLTPIIEHMQDQGEIAIIVDYKGVNETNKTISFVSNIEIALEANASITE